MIIWWYDSAKKLTSAQPKGTRASIHRKGPRTRRAACGKNTSELHKPLDACFHHGALGAVVRFATAPSSSQEWNRRGKLHIPPQALEQWQFQTSADHRYWQVIAFVWACHLWQKRVVFWKHIPYQLDAPRADLVFALVARSWQWHAPVVGHDLQRQRILSRQEWRRLSSGKHQN